MVEVCVDNLTMRAKTNPLFSHISSQENTTKRPEIRQINIFQNSFFKMSEIGELKKSRKELRAEIAEMRARLDGYGKALLLLTILSFALGAVGYAWMWPKNITNSPVVIHSPLFEAMDRRGVSLVIEPARVQASGLGTVECIHPMQRAGASNETRIQTSWECYGDNGGRMNVRVYNYTETPDDRTYLSCMMNSEGHIYPPSCLFHARAEETPREVDVPNNPYFYNSLHELVFMYTLVPPMFVFGIIVFGYNAILFAFFFVCEMTWYAPLYLLLLYLGDKAYSACYSKYPWFSKTAQVIHECLAERERNSFQKLLGRVSGIWDGASALRMVSACRSFSAAQSISSAPRLCASSTLVGPGALRNTFFRLLRIAKRRSAARPRSTPPKKNKCCKKGGATPRLNLISCVRSAFDFLISIAANLGYANRAPSI
jgi:hypothetical protein